MRIIVPILLLKALATSVTSKTTNPQTDCDILHAAFPSLHIDTQDCCDLTNIFCNELATPGIVGLDLGGKKLKGPIPTLLGRLTLLTRLDLTHNALHGSIPSQLANLKALQILDLSFNALSGQIPTQLSGLENLLSVDLSHNRLTGPIPPLFHTPASNGNLNLAQNAYTGAIPDTVRNASTLDLSQNGFTGHVPRFLLHADATVWSGYVSRNLSRNALEGPAPALADLGALMMLLDLSHNRLIGKVRGACPVGAALEVLDWSHNALSGGFPDLRGCAQLVSLNLGFNALTGALEATKVAALGRALETLVLSWNRFSGEIPAAVAAFPGLKRVALDYNEFRGRVPEGRWSGTMEVALEGNALTGCLPKELQNVKSVSHDARNAFCNRK